MDSSEVGIREFRADLAEYIASSTPVAVTRHGQTVGYFIPAHAQADADMAALKKASKTLDRMLAAQGVDAEAVVADFKAARKQAGARRKLSTRVACAARRSSLRAIRSCGCSTDLNPLFNRST